MKNQPYLSFVIPIFNEEKNIPKLHKEVCEVGKRIKKTFEIIYVDDGSFDNSPKVLNKLKPAQVITFRKNFGQTAALDAGIKAATGKFIVTLDGDGQNSPFDVPLLLKKLLKEDIDVVCGWRKNRKDTLSKRFISAGARYLRSFLIKDNIHDSGCTLRIYKSECFEDVNLRGEMHRFIPAILKWRGFKISETPVNHRSRRFGSSKYTFSRTIKGFLDMLSLWFFGKFASRPLHMLGFVGMMFVITGMLIGFLAAYQKLFMNVSLSDTAAPLLSVFLILFGMQMFVSGLMMDLIIVGNSKSHYIIKSKKVKK